MTRELPIALENLKEILNEAAIIVREEYSQNGPPDKKPDGSLLTSADVEVHRFLQEKLIQLYPKAALLSEEGAGESSRFERSWVWIVDPLDGTREFVRKIGEFAISVGLIHNRRLVAGGVINPITGEGGVGSKNQETLFWGMTPIPAGAKKNLKEATISISRRELEDGTVLPFLRLMGTTRPIGSVAYRLLRVASGLEDMSFFLQHKSEWDICGGIGVLESAGKVYRRLDGKPIRFNQRETRIRSGAVAGDEFLVDAFLASFENQRLRQP
jgi:myo-inositol-1(or 4)-monophosphatase